MVSDLEPLTPQPTTPPKAADCSTQTNWSEDGLFRVPPTEAESLENIGQRTRSKFSLSNTALETIEQLFVPPDITTDMYDLECDNEDWREFLEEFTQPLSECKTSGIIQEEGGGGYVLKTNRD